VVQFPEKSGLGDLEPITDASPVAEREWEFKGIRVQLRGSRETASRLQLYRGEELLLEEQLRGFLAGEPQALDLDADGQPKLILGTFSGGAHCCFDYYLYSLGEKPQRLAVIPAKHSELTIQENPSSDDLPAAVTLWVVDWTFQFWTGGSFASAPSARVALRLCEGHLHVDEDHMRKKSALEELQQYIQNNHDYQQWKDGKENPSGLDVLVDGVLDLIYTGHLTDAEQLLNTLWPANAGDSNLFLHCLKRQLQTSPYYGGLRELNGEGLAPVEDDQMECPEHW
jgi:hypothetical protein